jgi:hypothetical protein
MWRRLKVTFPDSIATHSTVQIFYFGSDGPHQAPGARARAGRDTSSRPVDRDD